MNQASIDSNMAAPYGASNLISSHTMSQKLGQRNLLATDAFDDTDDISSIQPEPASDHATRIPLKRTLSHVMALDDCSQPSKRLKMNAGAGKEYICEHSLA